MLSTGSDCILDGTFSLSTGGPGHQLHLQVSGDQGGSVHLTGTTVNKFYDQKLLYIGRRNYCAAEALEKLEKMPC